MKKALNVIPIRKALPKELPIANSTCYKNHSLKKLPRLIYKVKGCGLCFDLDEWASMCEEAKAKSVAESKRVHRSFED